MTTKKRPGPLLRKETNVLLRADRKGEDPKDFDATHGCFDEDRITTDEGAVVAIMTTPLATKPLASLLELVGTLVKRSSLPHVFLPRPNA